MATSCEELVLKQIIIGGDDGAVGPIGPAGPGTTFPIEATNISVTNVGYANLQEVLDFLLNVPLTIDSFSTPTTLFEKRLSTDASADFTMNFTWTLNKAVTGGSQTLDGPGAMTPVVLTTAERSKLVTLTDYNTDFTFVLTATTDIGGQAIATKAVTFTNRIYYGDSAIPGAIDGTFIASLTNILQTSYNGSYASNTDATKYFWFAYPVAYGTPTLMVGAFALDAQSAVLVSFTNSLGHTENYNVIRATNHSLGNIFVDVT